MKKPNKFDVLSEKICIEHSCNNRIKQNVIDRKPNTIRCMSCHSLREARTGHEMADYHKLHKKIAQSNK